MRPFRKFLFLYFCLAFACLVKISNFVFLLGFRAKRSFCRFRHFCTLAHMLASCNDMIYTRGLLARGLSPRRSAMKRRRMAMVTVDRILRTIYKSENRTHNKPGAWKYPTAKKASLEVLKLGKSIAYGEIDPESWHWRCAS
jgi:hypothetical protein